MPLPLRTADAVLKVPEKHDDIDTDRSSRGFRPEAISNDTGECQISTRYASVKTNDHSNHF